MDPEQDTFPDQGTQQLEQEPRRPAPYMPAPQQPQQPLGLPPEQALPWGAADNLELQRHMAGLAQVEKDVANGTLSEEEGQQATGLVMPRLQGLLKKQQQAQQAAKTQQVQGMMQGAALEEGVAAIHKQTRAQNFGKEVASLVDPVSGHRAYFTQDKNGDWSEVKFDHAHQEVEQLQPEAEGAAGDQGEQGSAGEIGSAGEGITPASYEAPTGAPQPARSPQVQELNSQGIATLGQAADAVRQGRQPGDAGRASPEPGSFEQTIQSGPFTEKYRGGQLVESNRPKPEAATKGDKYALSEAQIKAFGDLAERQIPRLRPGASQHEILHRMDQVTQLRQALIGHATKNMEAERAKDMQLDAHKQKKELETHLAGLKVRQELALRAEARQEKPPDIHSLLKEAETEHDHQHAELKKNRDAELKAAEGDAGKQEAIRKKYEAQLQTHQKEKNAWVQYRAGEKLDNWRAVSGRGGSGGGGNRPPPPPSQQLTGFEQELNGGQGVGTGSTPPPEVPPEHADKPSSIGVERVRAVLPFARNAMEGAQAIKRGNKGKDLRDVTGTLEEMHGILNSAHEAGKPLTIQQRASYETLHRSLQQKLRDEGAKEGEWQAPWLRLADMGTGKQAELPAPPGSAKPASKPAASSADDVRKQRADADKANQEHLRWLQRMSREAKGDERSKIDKAVRAAEDAIQYEKMDKYRYKANHEEGVRAAQEVNKRVRARNLAQANRPGLSMTDKRVLQEIAPEATPGYTAYPGE